CLADFYSWNPAVGSSCSYLDLGDYVCVDILGYTITTWHLHFLLQLRMISTLGIQLLGHLAHIWIWATMFVSISRESHPQLQLARPISHERGRQWRGSPLVHQLAEEIPCQARKPKPLMATDL
ncbi:hypothetical protein N7522_001510, partial [Penicillium canescens]